MYFMQGARGRETRGQGIKGPWTLTNQAPGAKGQGPTKGQGAEDLGGRQRGRGTREGPKVWVRSQGTKGLRARSQESGGPGGPAACAWDLADQGPRTRGPRAGLNEHGMVTS